MGNKTSHPLSEPEDPELSKLPPSGRSRTRDPTESIEEAEDVEVEVPPPMRPISSIPAPGGEDSKPRVRYCKSLRSHLTPLPPVSGSDLSSEHPFLLVTEIFLQFIKLEKLIVNIDT